MTINFNVPGAKRKELVKAISEWLGCESKYLGMPTCSYKIGCVTIDRDGGLTTDETAKDETIERLLEYLYDEGFEGDMNADSDSDSRTEARICISLPEGSLTEEARANLTAMTAAKAQLFKKAFGVDSLPIEYADGKISFPWLRATASPEEIRAFDSFICAFCEMARNAKRVTAKEKEITNDKYAMRCFLLRLGFIGNEYKEIRKTLLRNLSGSSAFKTEKEAEQNV